MLTYNKELFKGIFDNMTSGCAIYEVLNDGEFGKDYIVKEFNNASLAIERKSRGEVVGKSLAELRPNIDDYGLIDIFRKVWKTGESETFPTKIYTDENFNSYYENYVFCLYTGEIVAIYDNRTEFESNKEKIEQQKELFTSFFNNMLNGCAIYEVKNDGLNPADYIVSEYSATSSRMGGISREEAVGSNLEQRVGKKEAKELVEVLRRVWKTGESEKFHLATQRNGEYHFEDSVFRLSDREVATIYSDVTDEILNKNRLKESEYKFRLMFDNAPLGYQSADESGKILKVNKAWTDIFGYSENEIVGKNFRELIDKDYLNLYDSSYISFKEVGKIQISVRAIRKDGDLIFIKIDAQKLEKVEGDPKTLWIIQDITEQKRLQDENIAMEAHLRNQQKLESIGVLAGGVAHEINNPINGIMNYGQLIFDLAEKGSEQAGYAQEIIHETNRVAEIVRNLLQFSRQEKQTFAETSMNDIISHTLSFIRTIIRRDHIEIVLDIEENMPSIMCRGQQLQQVLMNLLTNARDSINEKFKSESDYKIIKVKGETVKSGENEFLRVTVEDNGNGVPDKIKDNIFDPFFTTKGRDSGTGLGLSISHGIVKEHNGKLYFKTEPGKFTKFIMEIPVE
ncbi:MAG: PAS domain S-box protein [Clostridiales bacterium]|nr:PAS domain S-box protein [Clostridiales bacterium]